MYFVYILKSKSFDDKYYVGFTKDVNKRIEQHNTSPTCNQTSIYGPWKLIIYIAFEKSIQARQFEKYLKTSSGKSFL